MTGRNGKLVRHQQDQKSAKDDRHKASEQEAPEMRGEFLGRRGLFKLLTRVIGVPGVHSRRA